MDDFSFDSVEFSINKIAGNEFTEDQAKKLDDLCYELDKEYDINQGGCIFVAYLISEQFFKYGIDYKILGTDNIEYYCGDKHEGIKHVFIEAANHLINGTREERKYETFLYPSQVLEYYKSAEWNSIYDTKNNDKIRLIITEFFKTIFK